MGRGLPPDVAAQAALDEALDPALTKARLAELATSRVADVRAAIAARLDCPLGVAVTLADDGAVEVRAALAANPSTQSTLLEQLAGDRSVDVARAVAGNQAASYALLARLSAHRNSEVKDLARSRMRGPAGHFDDIIEAAPELAERAPVLTLAPEPVEPPPVAQAPPTPIGGIRAPKLVPELEPEEPAVDSYAQAEQEALIRTAPVRGFRPPKR